MVAGAELEFKPAIEVHLAALDVSIAHDRQEISMNYSQFLEPKFLSISDRWIVVDKPSGWLTIEGRSGPDVPVLRQWVKERQGEVWVVHRLDRETSGVILFARSAQDHLESNSWFRQRKVKKTYLSLVEGNAQAPFFKISDPIEGQPSSTQVEVVEKFPGFFLLKAFPRTGRRHQIRIHLAKVGYPLLGDPRYGGPEEIQIAGQVLPIPRVALHASSLELPSGEKFEASLPVDFVEWLRVLRNFRGGTSGV